MRDKIVAGNWKMNKDWEEGISLASEILQSLNKQPHDRAKIVLAPPFIHLAKISQLVSGAARIYAAAQNCHQESSGAYTGEISASMLESIGTKYVILGHSERREYYKESNELLAQKVNAALDHGLIPIFCCGEPLAIRESNDQMEYVSHQLTASLFHLSPEEFRHLVIAYEPIWAIGTGKTASAAQAQEMHLGIRNHLTEKFGREIADKIPVLYGGSCKPSNAAELFAGPDVDGGLIGGASLDPKDFLAIVRSL